MFEVICHVLIQIFRLNLVAEAVRVGKQKPRPICAVLTVYMFVVKFVREDFGQLQHHKTSVHGFILQNFLWCELDHDQIFVDDSDILNGRFRQGFFDSLFVILLRAVLLLVSCATNCSSSKQVL